MICCSAKSASSRGESQSEVAREPGIKHPSLSKLGKQSDQATLSVATARAILDLEFREDDKDRMRELSAKAQAGSLSADEQAAINNYERVGHILSLMKSKARRSLSNG
ncbi:hypothetical protein SBA5_1140004 [Candidatus Sulfotelmatomonas gaucii]|uniref:Uncharacterized protein n=1 Tax=Candidatus Sulfuritelmatomonas gaucii TaxID=2043161 RepID=A0A2N9L3J1_9BACT|nr:hypothetical protein SBA5_1140004 [Candidatus Sulfotelmatomonas gaucii]